MALGDQLRTAGRRGSQPQGSAPQPGNRRRVEAQTPRRRPTLREVGTACKAALPRILPGLAIASSVAASAIGLYAGYQWFTQSERFAITEIAISGNSQVRPEKVRELLSADGQNIFTVDTGRLEEALIVDPWILRADVRRDFPNGLEVDVTERKALAAVELGGLYLVDDSGLPFKKASIQAGELQGLCVLSGISRDEYQDDPGLAQQRFQNGVAALKQYEGKASRPAIGEVFLDKRRGITLITYENAIAIHLGTAELSELPDRLQAFDAAWASLDSHQHAVARAFRIADRTPSDRVTVAFAGN